jgi:hypothetical protein
MESQGDKLLDPQFPFHDSVAHHFFRKILQNFDLSLKSTTVLKS